MQTRTWDFKPVARVSLPKGISEEDAKLLREKLRIKSFNESVRTFTIIFILFMYAADIVYKTPFFSGEPEKERIQRVRAQPVEAQQRAIRVLMVTGINHLQNNETEEAIREFVHILLLEPDHREAKSKLLLAYMVDCELNSRNCDEALYLYGLLSPGEKETLPIDLAEKLELLELLNNDIP